MNRSPAATAKTVIADRRDGRKAAPPALFLRHADDACVFIRFANDAARAAFPARAHGDGHAARLRERHAAVMQHLCAFLCEQQHVVIRDHLAPHSVLADARVRGKYPVHVCVDDELISLQRRGERHCTRVRAAASERRDVAIFVDALKARRDHNAALGQLFPDTRGVDQFDLRVPMCTVRFDGDLPCAEGYRLHADGPQRHRAERGAHLLARGEQHVELARRRPLADLLCLLQQAVRRVALRGENDDHVVAFVHPRFDDARHAQKMRIVAHGAAAEFLYDQAHKNHFQQKMD